MIEVGDIVGMHWEQRTCVARIESIDGDTAHVTIFSTDRVDDPEDIYIDGCKRIPSTWLHKLAPRIGAPGWEPPT